MHEILHQQGRPQLQHQLRERVAGQVGVRGPDEEEPHQLLPGDDDFRENRAQEPRRK